MARLGMNGRSNIGFERQVELDIHDIDRVGPLDEIAILGKTIPAVVTGRGAY